MKIIIIYSMTRARVSSRNTRICGAGRAPGVRAKREARRHRERHARCLRPGGRRLHDGDTHRSWRQRRQGRSGRLRWQDDTPAQAWLAMRLGALPVDYLFVARSGTPLTRDYATHLLHRLSRASRASTQDRPPRAPPLCRDGAPTAHRQPGTRSPSAPARNTHYDAPVLASHGSGGGQAISPRQLTRPALW